MAIQDYEEALILAETLTEEEKIYFSFNALFGSMIAYFNDNRENDGWNHYQILKKILDDITCQDCQKKLGCSYLPQWDCFSSRKQKRKHLSGMVGAVEITGPDQISIRDCLARVETIEKLAKELVSFAKQPFQSTLNILIDDLARRATRCCWAGGLWKGCLQPLADKWYKWDQKWKLFHIPPDPVND